MTRPPDPLRGGRMLIVNADDMGISEGVSRGILQAHAEGVVTSTSLMVDAVAAGAAAAALRALPGLGAGIHLQLSEEGGAPRLNLDDARGLEADVRRQVERFDGLVGRLPTHVDTHHNIHRDPRVGAVVAALGTQLGVPVRERSRARYVSSFYAVWDDGLTHPEWVSTASLLRILDEQAAADIVELGCHPGYAAGLRSGYAHERELELRTLCDPRLPGALAARGLRLVDFRSVGV